jgi:hypothetical protein
LGGAVVDETVVGEETVVEVLVFAFTRDTPLGLLRLQAARPRPRTKIVQTARHRTGAVKHADRCCAVQELVANMGVGYLST